MMMMIIAVTMTAMVPRIVDAKFLELGKTIALRSATRAVEPTSHSPLLTAAKCLLLADLPILTGLRARTRQRRAVETTISLTGCTSKPERHASPRTTSAQQAATRSLHLVTNLSPTQRLTTAASPHMKQTLTRMPHMARATLTPTRTGRFTPRLTRTTRTRFTRRPRATSLMRHRTHMTLM